MSVSVLILIVLALGVLGFILGRARAMRSSHGDAQKLHSRPNYYGWNVLICTCVPALLLLLVWVILQPVVTLNAVSSSFDPDMIGEGSARELKFSQIQTLAGGLDAAIDQGVMSVAEANSSQADLDDIRARVEQAGVVFGSGMDHSILRGAQKYRALNQSWSFWRNIVVLALAAAGFVISLLRTDKNFRARNVVEKSILALLILASSIAILTTVAIVLSMLFESIRFFRLYSPVDFFFGFEWAANFRGDSKLGFLPLLWGTLYISLIALIVAVPIGLFAAIYLSEYASSTIRNIAKPLLEILAGIPTIVYGLFALTTFGPLLLQWFGESGMGWMSDARSVLTAGMVMGIMLIPFVSSLSDDIINAVPQAMRDGSLGLGATQSETVRQVIIPAALPGIVGAILLAASRAIGETMIVVMGAGATAAVFYDGAERFLNPFEIMTTITTRIVAQLTGDGAFDSPETLVAFALGLTLFIMTLMLNVYALYIVRKYQEQYA